MKFNKQLLMELAELPSSYPNNRKLIITWIPDVLSMVDHNGSFKKKAEDNLYPNLKSNDYKGLTTRSERECFKNIKTLKAAEKILSKRNKSQIQFATYNNEAIYSKNELK